MNCYWTFSLVSAYYFLWLTKAVSIVCIGMSVMTHTQDISKNKNQYYVSFPILIVIPLLQYTIKRALINYYDSEIHHVMSLIEYGYIAARPCGRTEYCQRKLELIFYCQDAKIILNPALWYLEGGCVSFCDIQHCLCPMICRINLGSNQWYRDIFISSL